jgi:UDP-N-acetylmuramyl pentapeptide phosphotransferase/UDP-N-acetylglucosamine-1-phosphate transferase
MKIELIYLLIFPILLFTINLFLKKINFLVEGQSKSTHRKIFSTKSKKIQSGGVFFTVILLFLLSDQNLYLTTSLILILLLGIFSDVDFITSPKIRFVLQLMIISFLIISTSTFIEYTKIVILDTFIQSYFFSLIFSSFCILILINGCNFIDGANNLLIGYFLIISGCILYKFNSGDIIFNKINLEIIILSLIILLIFNFLSIIIMGDSGAYVLGLFFGFFLIHLSNINLNISPIYIVNLLWYPAFENLFSILRKIKNNISISEPDNSHLHHLLYKLINKKLISKKYNNSLTGLAINLFNLITLSIATMVANHSLYLTIIIFFNIFIYVFIYILLIKKN